LDEESVLWRDLSANEFPDGTGSDIGELVVISEWATSSLEPRNLCESGGRMMWQVFSCEIGTIFG